MKGFEKVPDQLALDQGLTLQARAIYPVLLHLVFRAGGRAGERVELPPLQQVADQAGCGVTALKGYIAELRRAGWVETRRAARGRPQTYVVHASPREPESGPQKRPRETESGPRVRRNPAHSRARDPSPSDKEPDEGLRPSPGEDAFEPPPIVMIDGRNLPLDALASECHVDPASPRYGQAVAALNGRGGEPGIRHLFWEEATRWAIVNGQEARFDELRDDPERFTRALETAIRRKAAKYRQAMPGAALTPTALRGWWLDVELAPAVRGGGLSPEQIERIEL